MSPTNIRSHSFTASANGLDVSAFVHIPSQTHSRSRIGIILAHGAGGNMDSPAIKSLANVLEVTANFVVVRFTATSLSLDHRVKQYRAVADYCISFAFKEEHLPRGLTIDKWLYGGRSMGARAACAAATKVSDSHMRVGVIAFSYPLHTETNMSKLRDELLIDLDEASVPLLFVSGTRDSMCKLDTLAKVQSRMPKGLHRLVKICDATHSGTVKGGKALNEKLEVVISRVVASWVDTLVGGEGRWSSHKPCVKVVNKDIVEEWEPLDQQIKEAEKALDTPVEEDIEEKVTPSEVTAVENKRRSTRKRNAT